MKTSPLRNFESGTDDRISASQDPTWSEGIGRQWRAWLPKVELSSASNVQHEKLTSTVAPSGRSPRAFTVALPV